MGILRHRKASPPTTRRDTAPTAAHTSTGVIANSFASSTYRLIGGNFGRTATDFPLHQVVTVESNPAPHVRRHAMGEQEHLHHRAGRKRLHHGAGGRLDFRGRLA